MEYVESYRVQVYVYVSVLQSVLRSVQQGSGSLLVVAAAPGVCNRLEEDYPSQASLTALISKQKKMKLKFSLLSTPVQFMVRKFDLCPRQSSL